MKEKCSILVLAVLCIGCASGIRTKRMGFICDPGVDEGRDVLVNVVFFDKIQDAVSLSQDLDKQKEGPAAWFGGRGLPRHESYDTSTKQVFDLRPQTDKDMPQFYALDKTDLHNAQALVVVAEYGERTGSKTVIELDKTNSIPKPRATEYAWIGPGNIKRMGRSWWFFGWHGSLVVFDERVLAWPAAHQPLNT